MVATKEIEGRPSVVTCPDPDVSHLDQHGYLYGYPIAHSLSPLFHRTIFHSLGLKWDYLLLPSTDTAQFLRLVRSSKCYGSGVTMPHKISILPYLDDVTPECRAVGACNTIFRRGSQLVGTNTDIIGIRESFYQEVENLDQSLHGRPGLVIGGGGAAKSAVYALEHFLGCKTVYLVNRDKTEVEAIVNWCQSQGYGNGLIHISSVSQAEIVEGAGAIVACVPNFPPSTVAEKLARRITEVFLSKSHKGAILEMCYHPTPFTEIAAIAEKAGWQVILGTEAMIYQGFEQACHWTGKSQGDLPVQRVKEVITMELKRSRLEVAEGHA